MPLPWPLVLTRTVSSTTPINAPTDDVLQYLHDPDRMISGGSLVIDRKVDPSNPLKYTITDKLDVLGLWSSTTTYDALFEPKDEGTDVTVNAPMGTRLQQRWRVRGKDEGSAEMTEEVEVQALFFFMPYILKTMIKSHREGNERIKAELEGKHVDGSSKQSNVHTYGLAVLILVLSGLVYTSHLLIALSIFGAALMRPSSRGDDPYGLFHLALNRRMGDPPNVDPKTEWLNMGYWKDMSDFPTACEALALRMVRAARIRPNARVLDVGHGTGESLLLLLRHPAVPVPAHLVGITSLPAHARRSAQRVERFLQTLPETERPQSVTLHCADAVRRPAHATHPFNSADDLRFDTILALDCAYHFRTRFAFLQQALSNLAVGGRIALADIAFDDLTLDTHRSKLIRAALRMMPPDNVWTTTTYVKNMEQMGYVDVTLKDITDDVFPGFVGFLKSRGRGWWAFGALMEVYFSAGARFIIVSGERGNA
ncbi:S-adenosyl-L-methionine-dependent methyltransferase [Schizophyllum commune Tattone D]|nr:S-adenosyl-L-methionine-dependent methyltransferase [Schizophyllum commune Tattone D]